MVTISVRYFQLHWARVYLFKPFLQLLLRIVLPSSLNNDSKNASADLEFQAPSLSEKGLSAMRWRCNVCPGWLDCGLLDWKTTGPQTHTLNKKGKSWGHPAAVGLVVLWVLEEKNFFLPMPEKERHLRFPRSGATFQCKQGRHSLCTGRWDASWNWGWDPKSRLLEYSNSEGSQLEFKNS